MAEAKALLREHFKVQLESGLFDTWVSTMAQTMWRPESLAIGPIRIRDKRSPSDRMDNILAHRAKGRLSNGKRVQTERIGRTAAINLLAFALAVDCVITPHVVQPLRQSYLFPFLARRFLGRKAIVERKVRLKTKLIRTGRITYTANGPVEELKRVETEEVEQTAYRIKRSDLKMIGKALWSILSSTLLVGGRQGQEWAELQDELRRRLAADPTTNTFNNTAVQKENDNDTPLCSIQRF